MRLPTGWSALKCGRHGTALRRERPDWAQASVRGLSRPAWLTVSELRIGLGCMRLSTEPDPGGALRVTAESLFVVVDSAVADSSGRWFGCVAGSA